MLKREYSEAEKRKIRLGRCITHGCRKPAKHGKYCHSCHKQRYAEKNPVYYCFMVRRQNARRRGKTWSLTFEEFVEFVGENRYMELKGRTRLSMSIDRERNEEGYHKNNIRQITVEENSRKGDRREYVEYFQRMAAAPPETTI